MRKLLLAGAAWLSFVTAAHASTVRIIDAGRLGPVTQYKYDSGMQSCSFAIADPTRLDIAFAIEKFDTDDVNFSFGNGTHWSSSGKVSVTIDGGPAYLFAMNPRPNNDTRLQFVAPEDRVVSFLHALWNGSTLAVTVGQNTTTFSLSGSATAIAVLNQCRDAIMAEKGLQGPEFPRDVPMPTVATWMPMEPVSPLPHTRVAAGPTQPYGAPTPVYTPPPAPTTPSTRTAEVSLSGEGRHREIAVTLNGVGPYSFILDTGADGCQVPQEVANTVRRQGALSSSDKAGIVEITVADGSSYDAIAYNFSAFSFGNLTVHNVKCIVSPPGTDGLLGMAVLSRFDSYTIDNTRNTLVLYWTK